jgi:hypothetical protein
LGYCRDRPARQVEQRENGRDIVERVTFNPKMRDLKALAQSLIAFIVAA